MLIVYPSLSVVHADEASRSADPSLEAQLEQLTTSVYCYCGCTRETIQHCMCGTAQQVEDEFRIEIKKEERHSQCLRKV